MVILLARSSFGLVGRLGVFTHISEHEISESVAPFEGSLLGIFERPVQITLHAKTLMIYQRQQSVAFGAVGRAEHELRGLALRLRVLLVARQHLMKSV